MVKSLIVINVAALYGMYVCNDKSTPHTHYTFFVTNPVKFSDQIKNPTSESDEAHLKP